MRDSCCICGRNVSVNSLFGNTGISLSDGSACYNCCKLAGYKIGLFSKPDLSETTSYEFKSAYTQRTGSSTVKENTAKPLTPTPELEDIIRKRFGPDNKMLAIKYVKDETGCSLKDAKFYVEKILR